MTKQMEDLLYYQGRKYFVGTYLLESYFKDHPQKRPEIEVQETCLWRGHMATFEIREAQLFLTELEVLVEGKQYSKSVLEEVFPDNQKMDWYSGLLPLEFPNAQLHLSQNAYKFLEIKAGNLLRERHFNRAELEQFEEEQFGWFQMTDAYKELAKWWRLKNPDYSEERIAGIIRDRILHYTTEVFVD